MFFICIYIHTGRGIYYGSYFIKEVWIVGVTILFVSILTAFLGYVLPWGQISYWAATVITNLISAIPYLGSRIVFWVWGGFSVDNATLTRFYTFHFLFPFALTLFSLIHLYFLHSSGSNNPLGLSRKNDVLKFQIYFLIKDFVGFILLWIVLFYVVIFFPMLLIDPENFIPANPLVTPNHIQPEWYFLPMYAVLRSIPNKLGGVIALAISIGILYFLPFIRDKVKNNRIFISQKIIFWNIVSRFIILMWIGRKPVEPPFEKTGQVITLCYFLLFFIIE